MGKYQLSEQQRYENAKKQAREIRSFYYNLLCYCIVIPMLIFINLTFVPEFHWFWFSMLGWGFGLTMHGLNAFGKMPFGKKWEQQKINEIIGKEQQKSNNQYQ